jgi:kinesin family protein 2/24
MYLNELQQVKDVPKIRVIVRKRPLNSKELKKNDIDTIEIRSGQTVVVKELKNKVDLTKYIEEHHFTFDNSYDENSTNEMVIQISLSRYTLKLLGL